MNAGRRRGARVWPPDERVQLRLVLVLALSLRVGFLLLHGPWDHLRGGDGPWYLQQAWLIARHALPHPLSGVGPVYPLVLASVWLLAPQAPFPVDVSAVPAALLAAIRLAQIGLSLVVVWLVYHLARGLSGRHGAGLVAAIGVGLGPAFAMEPFYVLTESVFMAMFTLGVWLHVRAQAPPLAVRFGLSGIILATAAMTRPAALVFPFLLAIPVFFHRPRGDGRHFAILMAAFLAALLPWGIYLFRATGSLLPEGFSSNLWIGAVGEGKWEGTQATYERSVGVEERGGYAAEALRIIGSDPLHWLGLRARNLAEAVLTPHGVSDLGGPSLKAMFDEWWGGNRSVAGLGAMAQVPTFPLKLAIYGFHYAALGFGALGAVVSWRRLRTYSAVYAGIVCLAVAYGVLTVLPRYLFPAESLVWVFAGAGVIWIRDRIQQGSTPGQVSLDAGAS